MSIWEKWGTLGHEVGWTGASFDDFSVFISIFWQFGHADTLRNAGRDEYLCSKVVRDQNFV